MNPTVFYEDRRRAIIDACDKSWEANKDNCSGFVKATLKQLGVSAHIPDVRANDLYTHFMNAKSDWFYVGSGQSATSLAGVSAHEGRLVVAAWKNPDQGKAGHVAIVTEYMSTIKAAKPEQRLLAYWGLLDAEGKRGEKITLSFGSAKLNDVAYFIYQGSLS